jgi:hypothetical protein
VSFCPWSGALQACFEELACIEEVPPGVVCWFVECPDALAASCALSCAIGLPSTSLMTAETKAVLSGRCRPSARIIKAPIQGEQDTPELRIGTSAFTAKGWDGTCYPQGIAAGEELSYYATQFDTVELDNTFYRTPAISTVKGWYTKTPPGFVFAAKVP